ncbi:bifunctional glutamate N-acetyltransferase/amino-acid acetyltransferase ArgJ [Stratiformator vulcanicus]|uniref:Arginine biosynthesis bifunctional protein ArgJ n=1 Tax=Stratiformator vulcanicus TaxID=2527980 RepID=A0A517R6Q1_9PLAN|nr:bifunctional glutamate N-acetyltransferase/amino-acid acetyltransferase ArgJ [Stratiformator vulcanicus]QDT39576.1 Arginine biosynthesis bifunctional protein ArgJ [Stratiformator vulcanicus]
MPDLHLPLGFQYAGVHCGVKSDAKKPDLSLFVSDRPCAAVGVYTQNRVVGAPVIVDRARTPSDSVRAVVINSGNANACTGERGVEDAQRMTALVAIAVDAAREDVLVCSTGIIGHHLPMEQIENGIGLAKGVLSGSAESLELAARGMMTTDTFPKIASRSEDWDGTIVTVTGACKGAAMIAPNMATMLAVVMTDVAIDATQASMILKEAVDESFNSISVDGHTSTSDTVLLLANGASGRPAETPEEIESVRSMVTLVCQNLAEMIIRDAEGAEHFVRIEIAGLPDRNDARKIAKTIAEGALCKTAITGNDPNWGRFVSAAGYSEVEFDLNQLSLDINGVRVFESGSPVVYDEALVSSRMAEGEVNLHLDFGGETDPAGPVVFLTSDLTAEYVRLNSEYTT